MSRIVISTIGSLRDLHPKIAVALELRNRGHDVIFATHKEYREKIEALGFEFYRMRPDNKALNDPEEMARMMDLKTGTEYVIKNWVCANLRETYNDLVNCAKNSDCIIAGEGVIAARIVAERLNIPWASVILQPLAFLSAYDASVLPVFPFLTQFSLLSSITSRGIRRLAKLLTNSMAEPVHQLRRELGLPPLKGNPFVVDKYSPDLVLAMFSSVLAKPQPDWTDNTVLTGFTFYDGSSNKTELTPELKRFLDKGKPPIIFTLGSAAVMTPGRFYKESIKATERLNYRAVLLIGQNTPPPKMPNNVIAIDYVPYSQIFPQASIIVHQGGIGTTAQALRSGRPTLVMPYSHDQPDNAARVRRLGTSRTIFRKHYKYKEVAKQLHKLLEDSTYAIKAKEIGSIIDAKNGAVTACDAIENKLL